MPRKRTLLQIPQGTESIALDEAFKHRAYIRSLEDLFFRWGYLPVQTPVFDFYDIYSSLLSPEAREKTYRLMDRDGELLMLRSDITLFLAKQVGLRLSDEELPLRVWYADTILRHQESEDVSSNEFFQVGSELIGTPGLNGDLEMLFLAARSLEQLKARGVVIHLGSRALVNEIFHSNPVITQSAIEYILGRQRDELLPLLADSGYTQKAGEAIAELLFMIGKADSFENVRSFARKISGFPEKALTEIDYIASILEAYNRGGFSIPLRYDLSEAGSQSYYTGIVFRAFMDQVGSPILSGGRYDHLLDSFGFDCPSVGFSLLLRKLESFLPDINHPVPETLPGKSGVEGFLERFSEAERLRQKGISVQM